MDVNPKDLENPARLHVEKIETATVSRKEPSYKFNVQAAIRYFIVGSVVVYYLGILPFRSRSVDAPRLPRSYRQGSITWTPCGDNIECGRLEVPLDYFNTSIGTASLAIARYPATNKTGQLGTFLANPGGPGVSGVSYIYRAGKRISDVLEGRYDVVSWDPRGINGTTPRVECFPSQTSQDIFFADVQHPDTRNLSDPLDQAAFASGLRLEDSQNAALVRLCHERAGDTLKYVGTASVVRDLVRLYDELEGRDAPINYWGFSYGTVIGSYLANMFPERVGKVVIDGVVDPDLWANTPAYTWPQYDLVDTEKDLNNFYAACAAVGPERCALASYGSTARELSDAVDGLLDKLYARPMPVWNTTRPGALTVDMVTSMMFIHLYRPRSWPELATNLAAALKGNGAPALEDVSDNFELNSTVAARTSQAIDAVMCIDTPPFPSPPPDSSEEEEEEWHAKIMEDVIDELEVAQTRTSRHFGANELDVCHHWKARAVERFTGPFNSTLAHEMLIIGNTADPITPAINARAVNKMMPDSTRLIIQDGSGHCSSAMTSLCTTKALRAYFFDGVLPENGLICPTDEVLFPPKDNKDLWYGDGVRAYSEEDLRLLENMRALGRELESYVGSFKFTRSKRIV